MITVWKQIPGFPNYEISECGEIRRHAYKSHSGRGNRLAPGQLLKLREDKDGYLYCELYNEDGKRRTVWCHRLVALAFIGPKPSRYHMVLHRDDDRKHNHFSNLRWGTAKDNASDAKANGSYNAFRDWQDERHFNEKLTSEQKDQIRQMYIPYKVSARILAEQFGVCKETIYSVLKEGDSKE